MLAAPAIYWLFGLPAMHANYLAFIGYAVPPLIAFWIWSAWSTDGRSLPLLTEVTHTVVAIPISIAVVSAILCPFGRPFKVTRKGNRLGGSSGSNRFWLRNLWFGSGTWASPRQW